MKNQIATFIRKIKTSVFSTIFDKCISAIKKKSGTEDQFAYQIIEKYSVPNVRYFDNAYMVLLRVKAEKKENIVPLYARTEFIMNQVKLYVEKEKTTEIYIVKQPAEPVNIFNTYHPSKFFENMNISTRREWGQIFYSFSKEYESFYEEQYHKKPSEETETRQTLYVNEHKRTVKNHLYEEQISELHSLKKQIEERETALIELEEQINTLIHKVVIHEHVIDELKQGKKEQADMKEEADVKHITQSVMNQLQIHLAQERMRHGY